MHFRYHPLFIVLSLILSSAAFADIPTCGGETISESCRAERQVYTDTTATFTIADDAVVTDVELTNNMAEGYGGAIYTSSQHAECD